MSLSYGMIWWKTYAHVIRYRDSGARLANIDAALVEVCRQIKVDIESVRKTALCAEMPDFSEYAEVDAEEIVARLGHSRKTQFDQNCHSHILKYGSTSLAPYRWASLRPAHPMTRIGNATDCINH
jgi:hypothetical protein